jgi:hypothetical protein
MGATSDGGHNQDGGHRERCTVEVYPEAAWVVVRVHDFSWSALTEVQSMVRRRLVRPGVEIRLDVGQMVVAEASRYWLAGIIALARMVRAGGGVLVVVSPPASLGCALLRARLPVEAGDRRLPVAASSHPRAVLRPDE